MATKTKAIVFINGEPKITTYNLPELEPEQLLVTVLYCGINSFDVAATYCIRDKPFIPGHDLIVRVAQAGPDAQYEVEEEGAVYLFPDSPYSKPSYPLFGGFAREMIIHYTQFIPIFNRMNLKPLAPFISATFTIFNPLNEFGILNPKLAIAFLGRNLSSQLASSLAHAAECNFTLLTTEPFTNIDLCKMNPNWIQENNSSCYEGAANVVCIYDDEEYSELIGRFHIIVDTLHEPLPSNDILFPLLREGGEILRLMGTPSVAQQLRNVSDKHLPESSGNESDHTNTPKALMHLAEVHPLPHPSDEIPQTLKNIGVLKRPYVILSPYISQSTYRNHLREFDYNPFNYLNSYQIHNDVENIFKFWNESKILPPYYIVNFSYIKEIFEYIYKYSDMYFYPLIVDVQYIFSQ